MGATLRIRLNDLCPAAVRAIATITLAVCYFSLRITTVLNYMLDTLLKKYFASY